MGNWLRFHPPKLKINAFFYPNVFTPTKVPEKLAYSPSLALIFTNGYSFYQEL